MSIRENWVHVRYGGPWSVLPISDHACVTHHTDQIYIANILWNVKFSRDYVVFDFQALNF